MKQFIHIPKTGGTSIRFMQMALDDWQYKRHEVTLADVEGPVVFTIRDPLDRLISAAKHQILEGAVTASNMTEYLTQLRKNDKIANSVFVKPISHWLGSLAEYKTQEHKVEAAVETAALNSYFSNLGIEPKHHRDSKKYNLIFDETISGSDLAWIEEHFREDFRLYFYIQNRPYYVGA